MKALDLIVSPSPHIHSGARITGTSYNFLIALLPAVIVGVSAYGFDALRVICSSIACAMVFEALIQKLCALLAARQPHRFQIIFYT